MTDEQLLAAAPSLPVLYFDGFGAYRKMNGVLRCVGYLLNIGPQYNIVTSLAGAQMANAETRRVLDEKQIHSIHIWGGLGLAH